jgi:hypothetical protein
MLSLLAQVSQAAADSLSAGADFGSDAFGLWSGLASIVGLFLTIYGVYKARKGEEAQRAAARTLADAEALRDQYTRKQRLPEYRSKLDAHATRLNTLLSEFDANQAEAQEVTSLIIQTLSLLVVHLQGQHLAVVTDLSQQIKQRSGLINLKSGQTVRSCTRQIVTYLELVIGDEQAKSL